MQSSPRILAQGFIDKQKVFVDTDTGEVHDWHDLPFALMRGRSGYVAGTFLYAAVAHCQSQLADHDNWYCRITGKRKTYVKDGRPFVLGHFLPERFGFRDPGKRGNGKSYHVIELEEVGLEEHDPHRVVQISRELLALCEERGIRWSAHRGGTASRMLKASPAWTSDRTAAPRFINDTAREQLPGNHYSLRVGVEPRHVFPRAILLDQSAAHHHAARSAGIPDPGTLRARGYDRSVTDVLPRKWLAPESASVRRLRKHYGMFCGVGVVQHIPPGEKHVVPKFLDSPGRQKLYWYSNEWEFIDKYVKLSYVSAAWTSSEREEAIPEYADWSLGVIGRTTERKAVKPLLLAAYGMLALRMDNRSTSYSSRVHAYSRSVDLPQAGRMAEHNYERKDDAPQPTICHVIARGIIEAETRKRSLLYAAQLESQGIKVLQVYVDALAVLTDQLPFLPPGWTVQTELTHARFPKSNQIISMETTKLPGLSKDHELRRASAKSVLGKSFQGIS